MTVAIFYNGYTDGCAAHTATLVLIHLVPRMIFLRSGCFCNSQTAMAC